jgi:hypothetical protein
MISLGAIDPAKRACPKTGTDTLSAAALGVSALVVVAA